MTFIRLPGSNLGAHKTVKQENAIVKHFHVKVVELKKVFDMPGSWGEDDYRNLLNQLEIEDVDEMSGEDLLEILFMGLQDLELEQAADLVLAYKLPGKITPGSRRNIIEDLLEGQHPWEEAADIGIHANIFAATVLLNKAFPRTYGKPDMMKLTLQIEALKPEAKKLLLLSPKAAFVTRLLADGMDERSILERLFDEQLASHSFPEAESIVWFAEYEESPAPDGDATLLTVYSSEHWLEDMESITEFESSAYNDDEPDGD